jgi:hypothetical protein
MKIMSNVVSLKKFKMEKVYKDEYQKVGSSTWILPLSDTTYSTPKKKHNNLENNYIKAYMKLLSK